MAALWAVKSRIFSEAAALEAELEERGPFFFPQNFAAFSKTWRNRKAPAV